MATVLTGGRIGVGRSFVRGAWKGAGAAFATPQPACIEHRQRRPASLQSAGHRLRKGTCPFHEAGDQRRSGGGPGDGVSRATAILTGRQNRRALEREDELFQKRSAPNDPENED